MENLHYSKKLILTGFVLSAMAWIILAVPVNANGVDDLGSGFGSFIKFTVCKFLATIFLITGGVIFFNEEFSSQRKSDLAWGFLSVVSTIDVGIIFLIFYLHP